MNEINTTSFPDIPDRGPTVLLGILKKDIKQYTQYLYPIKDQSGKRINDFDAHGIRKMCGDVGIGVVSNKVKETSDGKGWYVTATAKCIYTGRTNTAGVWQPKAIRKGSTEVEQHSLSKAFTRANRNAMKGMIPLKELVAYAESAIKKGEAQKSLIAKKIDEAKKVYAEFATVLNEHGIDRRKLYEEAQNQKGDTDDWEVREWQWFADSIKSWKTNWIIREIKGEAPF